MEIANTGVIDEHSDSFEKLGKATAPTEVGDLKMVVVKPDQKADTPMEIVQTTEASKGDDVFSKTFGCLGCHRPRRPC